MSSKAQCSIISCKNSARSTTADPNIFYFIAPALNTKEGKEWAIILKNSLTQYSGSLICHLHFHDSDMKIWRRKSQPYAKLRNGAVPKLMLSNDDSAMDVGSAHQDERTTKPSIDRTSVTPLIIQPKLSTERRSTKMNIEIFNQKPTNCDQCKANEMLRRQANERCRKLEEINLALERQNKCLLEKIRAQETKVNKMTIEENQAKQAEPVNDLTQQSQPNDGDAPSVNENDGDRDAGGDDLSVDCDASEEPPSNDPKNSGQQMDTVINLDNAPLNSAFFKCGVCVEPVQFQTPIELGKHMSENHLRGSQQISTQNKQQIYTKRSFECYICKLNLTKLSDVRRHIGDHVRARSEKCNVCDERCTVKELSWHLCASSGKSIQCEYCSKSFGAIAKLIKHIESEHEKEKIEHRCNKCSRFFVTTCLRDLHEKHHVKKLHACKICDRSFSSIEALSSHLKRHSVKDDYLCPVCGKAFKASRLLMQHIRTHRAGTIKCSQCPRLFHTNASLNYHLDMHMDKKFKCDQCSSILGTRHGLAKHKRYKHQLTEADKKFACNFCSVKFWKSAKLRRHMRKHNGEKPYACEYCPRRYKYQPDFKNHLKTHVGNDIYKCAKCDKGFYYHKELQKHLLEHYQQEQNEINSLKDAQKQ